MTHAVLNADHYSVMEHFYTLQGEGFWTGNAAYFIRLGGCDVGCTWCDVKESWNTHAHPTYSTEDITQWVENAHANLAVVTGGEPTLHNLTTLTDRLKQLAVRTHIETSGTNPLTGKWDWVTFSPKRFKKYLDEYHQHAHELKMIIAHRNDLRWAKEMENKMNPDCLLYIQTEWEQRATMESICIDFIKENPRWRLSLQTHKYLGID